MVEQNITSNDYSEILDTPDSEQPAKRDPIQVENALQHASQNLRHKRWLFRFGISIICFNYLAIIYLFLCPWGQGLFLSLCEKTPFALGLPLAFLTASTLFLIFFVISVFGGSKKDTSSDVSKTIVTLAETATKYMAKN
ncbi:MAG TPA: hypothetical protein DCS48_08000 [Desulfovibrio sp.]|nr:hypothetical protein [Desulfovibrio sp.]